MVLIGTQTAASARDSGGIQDFFAREFGIGATPEPQPAAPVWSEENPYDRPLVVRPRHARKPRPLQAVAVVKGPTGPVSIYEDRTLRRGDAVMTATGIRIFKGSSTMPYRDADFVAISQTNEISKDVAKTLLAMDRVPRG